MLCGAFGAEKTRNEFLVFFCVERKPLVGRMAKRHVHAGGPGDVESGGPLRGGLAFRDDL